MDSWHRRIPRSFGLAEPRNKAKRIEPGLADDRSTRRQRSEQSAYQPVDVKEGHHVQAAVIARQSQRFGDVHCRDREVSVGQWNSFRAARRSRGMEDEGDIFGARSWTATCGEAAQSTVFAQLE